MSRARARIREASESGPEKTKGGHGPDILVSTGGQVIDLGSEPKTKIKGSRTGASVGSGAVAPDCCVRDRRGIQCERAAEHRGKHGFDNAYGEWVEFSEGFVSEELLAESRRLLLALLPYAGESYDSMTNAQAKDCERTIKRVSEFLGR